MESPVRIALMKTAVALAALLVAAGCASLPEGAPRVSTLQVTPVRAALETGGVQRLLVEGNDTSGIGVDVTDWAGFESGNKAVLTVDAQGRVQAIAPGEASVTVKYDGHSQQVIITVRARPANQPLSFVKDVLPVLNKAGCNAGACHAKAEGQNGFKLSIFTYDPQSDHREIVEDARGRRVFPALPEESLLVQKPTLAVPHEGGQRIEPGSESHRILVQWIRDGMIYRRDGEPELVKISVTPAARISRKGQTQRLQVEAHYSDGQTRDVTGLAGFIAQDAEIATVDETGRVKVGLANGEGVVVARFMGQMAAARFTVLPERPVPVERYAGLPRNNFIDELAVAEWRRLGLFPSEGCSDAEFLRRASLDAIGRLPTVAEARAFLDDTDARKREKLIDRLLDDPSYADFWAAKWADLLRPNPDRVGVKSVFILDQWLRDAFRRNLPMDQFAREIVGAQGSTHRDGPAVVYRDRRVPAELTTIFSQLFMGVRLECARCHNHPNEKWSQLDFHSMAAFFGSVQRKGDGISPPISGGTEFFYHGNIVPVTHPVSGAVLAPKPPDGPPAVLAARADPRAALTQWLVTAENPFFARAMVNRVWGELFGRGLVEPVDDFRTSNPPVHAPLLDALARHFAGQGFDQKKLLRALMQSRLYQMSSMPNEVNAADGKLFSRSLRRPMVAEVLLDAVSDLTGVPEDFSATTPGARAVETWSYKIDSAFLDAFGRPNSSSDPPCERNGRGTIVQSLHLMHAERLNAKITHERGRARLLAEGNRPVQEVAEEMYLAAFSRRPTAEEHKTVEVFFVKYANRRREAVEDLMWALVNSAEFIFNH